jgi:hypothetical protein
MNGTGEYHPERGKPGPEDQKSYVLPYMQTFDQGRNNSNILCKYEYMNKEKIKHCS